MNVSVENRPPHPAKDGGSLPPNWDRSQFGPDEEPLDIRAMVRPVWRRKWLILACMLAGVTLGVFIATNTVPRYTANARVLFDPERLKIIELENVVVAPDISTTGLQNQIEILRSSVLLERVADILRLEDTPEFNPGLRVGPPPLFERIVDRATREIESLPLPDKSRDFLTEIGVFKAVSGEPLTPVDQAEELKQSIVNKLVEEIKLRPIPNSRAIEIGYTSPNGGLAASIVNTVADQYIAVQIERKRDDVAAATELLSVRVQDLENRLNAAEDSVEAARMELSQAAGYTSQMTDEQLQSLTTSISEARQARLEFERRYAVASDALGDADKFAIVPEFRGSEIIAGYRLRESELRDEAASLRAIVGEGNPSLTRIDARLQEVRDSIRTEAQNIVAGLKDNMNAAADRENGLAADLRELEGKALEQSRDEMRLQRLEREAAASRSIYDSFVDRLKETSEQAGLQTPDARFLTRATIPTRSDSRLRSVALASVAGLLAGFGLVVLLEMLNNTFRSPTDVETKTGLAVLGSIPRVRGGRRLGQLVARHGTDPSLAEAVRHLRTSVFYSNIDQPPKVIMLTSSVPAEGKSTTAMLLAIASQGMGHSSVIVDCDFRRGTVGNLYDSDDDGPGLLAVLEGTSSVPEAVNTAPGSGVHVLAREGSHMQGNSADIFASKRFKKLIDELRARYDLVVLDAPPVLFVSDARILAQVADAVVYMVRWNKTPQEAVTDGLRVLTSVNAKIAGVVLSLVNQGQASNYHVDKRYYHVKKKRRLTSA